MQRVQQASSRCQYEHWWRRKKLVTSHEHQKQLAQCTVSLPLLVVPPALDFDPHQFPRPPSYEEVIDLEKALQIHPKQSATNNGATHHTPTSSSNHLLEGLCSTQETALDSTRRSVRTARRWRFTIFTVYRRLFTLVFLLNFIGIFVILRQSSNDTKKGINLDTLATLASSNFLVAILVRQDFLINLLFRAAWLVPWYVPLKIRAIVARVYCYGGIHSGAALAGTLWWAVFTGLLSFKFLKERSPTFPIVVITWMALLLLFMIVLLALPLMRAKYHDTFEMTHRFLGWTSILLFWAQLFLLAIHERKASTFSGTIEKQLLTNPTFWNLTAITLLIIYPWTRLRQWTFIASPLSSHALQLTLPNKLHKFSCLSISSTPLQEWHPFATFPLTKSEDSGASMVISDAGNWTKRIIQDAEMRNTTHRATTQSRTDKAKGSSGKKEGEVTMRFWVKSHPTAGVLSLSCLFPRVLIVTTGSGIGPSLSSLLDRPANQFARLIWSTRAPRSTYGSNLLGLVHHADPDALIIDTSQMGRPNLLVVAWRMCREVKAEAVFVLSNEIVTRAVVGGLESRGVRAFGPIWDS
ncbi:hypothetical protein BKA66DRAFT_583040 [Pyrenochaeta sp. MPI-SDFR-AT-0127]|nr:hypothetical protein BKA66DRAFT_583040 [Pyrenochaeta sp. MPI-SDFR-AT-0127]